MTEQKTENKTENHEEKKVEPSHKSEEHVHEEKQVHKEGESPRDDKPKQAKRPAAKKPAVAKEAPKESSQPAKVSASAEPTVITATSEKPVEKEKKAPKKRAKKGANAIVARGKRKTSVARASIRKGRGVVRINGQNVTALNNKYVRSIILEPLKFAGADAASVDISVNVNGGGMMDQAQAVRTAIAHAIVQYFDNQDIKSRMVAYDRTLLVEDSRRVESKKYLGRKARARFQKSYR